MKITPNIKCNNNVLTCLCKYCVQNRMELSKLVQMVKNQDDGFGYLRILKQNRLMIENEY